MRIARKLVQEGEDELFEKAHPQPIGCKYFDVYCDSVLFSCPSFSLLNVIWNFQLQTVLAVLIMVDRWSYQIGFLIIGIHWKRHNIPTTLPDVNNVKKNMWFGGKNNTEKRKHRETIINLNYSELLIHLQNSSNKNWQII